MSNVYTALERMAGPIGFDIGASHSQVQADFFNGFARSFESDMDASHRDLQALYIADGLTPAAKRVLRLLVGFFANQNGA